MVMKEVSAVLSSNWNISKFVRFFNGNWCFASLLPLQNTAKTTVSSVKSHNPETFWPFVHSKNNTCGIPGTLYYQDIEYNLFNVFSKYF